MIELMIPNGKYFVGDPSLVLDNIPSLGDGMVQKIGVRNFLMISVGGDGEFNDAQGYKYIVEGGSIGLVPIELISPDKLDVCKKVGRLVNFYEPKLCKFIDDEFLMFGDVLFYVGDELDAEYEQEVEGRKMWEVWE